MSTREKERIDELVQGKEDLLDKNKWKALREGAVKDAEDKVYQHTWWDTLGHVLIQACSM